MFRVHILEIPEHEKNDIRNGEENFNTEVIQCIKIR